MIAHYTAYDEIAAFIASMDPRKLIQYQASATLQSRVDTLLEKNREQGLSESEKQELEHYLVLDHLISLAKIRAYKLLGQSPLA
jgi:hypothetical protein